MKHIKKSKLVTIIEDVLDKSEGHKKVIKESKKNCNKEEIKCEREVCICGRR